VSVAGTSKLQTIKSESWNKRRKKNADENRSLKKIQKDTLKKRVPSKIAVIRSAQTDFSTDRKRAWHYCGKIQEDASPEFAGNTAPLIAFFLSGGLLSFFSSKTFLFTGFGSSIAMQIQNNLGLRLSDIY